jgi:hypothetical protein
MTEVWVAIAIGVLLLVGLAGLVLVARAGRKGPTGERAIIENLDDATSLDISTGAVRSVQRADLLIDEDALMEIWTPAHLERLARTYWRFLTQVTLGLIRVRYTERERYIVLLIAPLKLLTFRAPEYEMTTTRGVVRWRIERGLLVSRRGRGDGYLRIEVQRSPSEHPTRARLHVEVEVANFYPAIASRLGRRLYDVTQSRIHVIVTYGFLRSLARLDLAESRVGSLKDP